MTVVCAARARTRRSANALTMSSSVQRSSGADQAKDYRVCSAAVDGAPPVRGWDEGIPAFAGMTVVGTARARTATRRSAALGDSAASRPAPRGFLGSWTSIIPTSSHRGPSLLPRIPQPGVQTTGVDRLNIAATLGEPAVLHDQVRSQTATWQNRCAITNPVHDHEPGARSPNPCARSPTLCARQWRRRWPDQAGRRGRNRLRWLRRGSPGRSRPAPDGRARPAGPTRRSTLSHGHRRGRRARRTADREDRGPAISSAARISLDVLRRADGVRRGPAGGRPRRSRRGPGGR